MLLNGMLCALRSGSHNHQYSVLRTAAASSGGAGLENATAQVRLILMIEIQILLPCHSERIRTVLLSKSLCPSVRHKTKQSTVMPKLRYIHLHRVPIKVTPKFKSL